MLKAMKLGAMTHKQPRASMVVVVGDKYVRFSDKSYKLVAEREDATRFGSILGAKERCTEFKMNPMSYEIRRNK
jgi:hypothetical protein